MSGEVTICEMAPRDGMQVLNRSATIPQELRLLLLQILQRAGFAYIEVGSFVHPKVLPQLQDTPALFAHLRPTPAGQLAALVPSYRFYEQFRETPNLSTIALFVSASEAYSQKNKRVSIEDDLADAQRIADDARGRKLRLRAHLSAAFRELGADAGLMEPAHVAAITQRLLDMGCETVALADTDGRAVPQDVQRTIEHVAAQTGAARLGVHLHDRYGQAMANAWKAYELGIRTFDSSVGGIGGGQAVQGAVGNVGTEQLVTMFERSGIRTGIDPVWLRHAWVLISRMTRLVSDPQPPAEAIRALGELPATSLETQPGAADAATGSQIDVRSHLDPVADADLLALLAAR